MTARRASSYLATVLLSFFVFLHWAPAAHAQNMGFELNRYQPTRPGEWSFSVDHPWYSSTRVFAAGLTLNYAYLPMRLATVDSPLANQGAIIDHQLMAHLDVAGSFLDRVNLSFSVPLVFYEHRGDQVESLSSSASFFAGDPRFGAMVRLWGQPLKDAFSIHIGADVWFPLRKFINDAPLFSSDQDVRVLPRVVMGGVYKKLLWSATAGVLYRPEAEAEVVFAGRSETFRTGVGSALQVGLAAAYYNPLLRLSVGPEILITERISGQDAWTQYGSAIEALVGLQYNIAGQVQVGLAGGTSFLSDVGSPQARVLVRLAYAPTRKPLPVLPDQDKDGIPDAQDDCPMNPGPARSNPARTNGCPDRDRDDVVDRDDLCPDVAKGPVPDPNKLGCPFQDKDGDGIPDGRDLCPSQAKGPNPDPTRLGCPAGDRDQDGVFDPHDRCPDRHQGLRPDPQKPGCPLPDRDNDQVPDAVDACPDTVGAPSLDPRKNGCPGLVQVKQDEIVILKPVFFATDRDVILKKSFPILQAVVEALSLTPNMKKICIHGHTDNQGKPSYNEDLSSRRAQHVKTWMVEHGLSVDRLDAKGFGQTWPVSSNRTAKGRSQNRRVVFSVVESSCQDLKPHPFADGSPKKSSR